MVGYDARATCSCVVRRGQLGTHFSLLREGRPQSWPVVMSGYDQS